MARPVNSKGRANNALKQTLPMLLTKKTMVLAGTLTCICHATLGKTELIANGGFESGSSWWQLSATGAYVNYATYAHGGTNVLVMGALNNVSAHAYQVITLPAETVSANLSYYYNVSSSDVNGTDYFTVAILNSDGTTIETYVDQKSNSDADAYWHRKTFTLTNSYAGKTIQIYFLGTTDSTYGNLTSFYVDDVSLEAGTTNDVPVNDYFTNRTVLTGSSVTASAKNNFASKEKDEPDHAGNAGGKSVWWTWTAPANGSLTLDTKGVNSFDTLLAIYTGSSVDSLTRVASNNDSDGTTSRVKVKVIAGTAYQIAVDGNDGAYGDITLHLDFNEDATLPKVSISSPAAGAKLTNSTVIVTGTASDVFGITTVEYRLENAAGTNSYQPADGTNKWSAIVSDLIPGPNTVRVRAYDTSGNVSAAVARTFNYVIVSPLTLTTSGNGTVSPNLNGQFLETGGSYTVTAKPGSGYIFSGWTGDKLSENTRLTFVMQSNMLLQANFIPNPFLPAVGTFQGLFYETNEVTHQSSGFFSANVTSKGGFTGKLQLAGKIHTVSGTFSAVGSASNSISRPGLSPISLQLQLDLSSGDVLTGQISDGNWTAELFANRNAYSKSNTAPQAGKYTVVIPGSDDFSAQPGGDGFGTITVDDLGNVKFSGTLGDGTKVTQRAALSKDAQWPFYASLYSGSGSILGWLTFADEPGNDISGRLSWIKLAQTTGPHYPNGFTNITQVIGSSYAFTNGVPLLNFSDGQVSLMNGNLSENFTNQVVFEANKITNLSGNQLTLTITSGSGLFKGSVVNPVTQLAIPFSGVIVQKQNFGSGYFLGTNQSGRVFFGPAL
jgi:hypothetical protein